MTLIIKVCDVVDHRSSRHSGAGATDGQTIILATADGQLRGPNSCARLSPLHHGLRRRLVRRNGIAEAGGVDCAEATQQMIKPFVPPMDVADGLREDMMYKFGDERRDRRRSHIAFGPHVDQGLLHGEADPQKGR